MAVADRSNTENPDSTSRTAPKLGYVVVLLGVVAYLVASFLHLYGPSIALRSANITEFQTYYRLMTNPFHLGDTLDFITGFVTLFTGPAIIAALSLVGMTRSPRSSWVGITLVVACVMWVSIVIPLLIRIRNLTSDGQIAVGYWALLASVAVVVIGSLIAVFARSAPDAST